MKKCVNCKSLIKCELCNKKIPPKNAMVIKNKINGKELTICEACGKYFNWI